MCKILKISSIFLCLLLLFLNIHIHLNYGVKSQIKYHVGISTRNHIPPSHTYCYKKSLAELQPKQKFHIKQQRKWTFMVYLDADNNLEDAGIGDFLEMSSVGSTSDVAIVVLMDRNQGYDDSYGNWTDARLFYIDKGEEPYADSADEDWGEVNMGDPNILINFTLHVIQKWPAEHYALILWDHGGGVLGACWDDDNNDKLDLSEIMYALEYIHSTAGITIDVLGFDACLMNLISTAYQLKDYIKYIVFSQEYEPGDGWPYDDILSELVNNPAMSSVDLARIIVQKYVQSYNFGSQGFDENATMAAVNVSYFAKHAFRKLDRLVGELLRYYDKYSSAIQYAINNSETFAYPWQKDLIHFLLLLRDSINNEILINIINETIATLNASIIAEEHLSGHSNAHGISACFQTVYNYYSYDYLLIAEHHQWNEFLKKLCGNLTTWFYDIKLTGIDDDNDGYYECINFTIDIDSDTSITGELVIFGSNGTHELKIAEKSLNISGITSDDKITIRFIPLVNKSIWNFRFVLYDQSGDKINELYYYSDDDVSDVRLEKDTQKPFIQITIPKNGTIFSQIVIKVNWTASDNIEIDHFSIYIDNKFYANVTNTSIILTLSEGHHNITVIVYDAARNSSSSTVYIIIDLTPPQLSLLQPINESFTNKTSITISWNGSDNLSGMDHFEILLENGSWINVGSSTSYTLENLSEGSHKIVVKAVDKAGNSNRILVIFTVDVTPPTLQILSPENNSILAQQSIQVSWQASDALSGIDHYEIKLDSGTWINVGTSTSYMFNDLIDGTHIVTVKAVDKAGNINSTSIIFIIDTTPPTIQVLYPKNNSYIAFSNITVSWIVFDNTSGVAHCEIKIDNGNWIDITNTTSYMLTNLTEGKHTINFKVTDTVGNSKELLVIFTVDLTPPFILITHPENMSELMSFYVNITWNASDNFGIDHFEIKIDNGSWINVNKKQAYLARDLSLGEHVVYVKAYDLAGNYAITMVYFTIKEKPKPNYIYLLLSLLLIMIAAIVILYKKKIIRRP